MFVWITLGVVLGGRIGYVIFYDPAHFLSHPIDALRLWEGGMSFHGGFLGVVVALYLYGRKDRRAARPAARSRCCLDAGRAWSWTYCQFHQWRTLRTARRCALGDDLSDRSTGVPRHPSQLYEALLEGLALFLAVRIGTHRYHVLAHPGRASASSRSAMACRASWSSSSASLIRRSAIIVGFFTMGMILSVPLIAVGVWLYIRSRRTGVTPLEGVVRAIIESEGPMRLDRYMALCLGHPQYGYYMTPRPIRRGGRFRDGAGNFADVRRIDRRLVRSAWQAMGSPSPFNLVEFGPGRGTLMADLLRAGRVIPEFVAAARAHLIETSPVLRAAQNVRLGGSATWHNSLASVPKGPVIFVANEFFDAIPIRQFEWREGTGFERCVGLGEGVLRLGLTPVPQMAEPKRSAAGEESQVIEDSSQRDFIAAEIGARLADAPGAALIIDYGHLHSAAGDTLQAVRRGLLHGGPVDGGRDLDPVAGRRRLPALPAADAARRARAAAQPHPRRPGHAVGGRHHRRALGQRAERRARLPGRSESASGQGLEVAVNLAYPLADLVLLGVIVGALAGTGWRLDRSWMLLLAGIAVFWLADSLYLVGNADGTYAPARGSTPAGGSAWS